MDIKLWNIYKLKTNAPTDVWTKKEIRKNHLDKKMINEPKYRFSVPIEKVKKIGNEVVYLIYQTNGTQPKYNNYFPVDGLMPLNEDKKFVNGYIIPINVRLALAGEWDDEFTEEKGSVGIVSSEARTAIYKACYILMNQSPRLQFIKDMKAGKYDKWTYNQLKRLVEIDQFDKFDY